MAGTDVPVHIISDNADPFASECEPGQVSWRCSCGQASGVWRVANGVPTGTFPESHLDEVTTAVMRGLSVGEVTELLRGNRRVYDSPGLAAATELLIGHGFWLADEKLRDSEFLILRWDAEDRHPMMEVRWRRVAEELGVLLGVIGLLRDWPLPDDVVGPVDDWIRAHDVKWPSALSQQPQSARAVLRFAAALAGAMPIRLDEAIGAVSEQDRPLLLAAVMNLSAIAG
jgi:hypothetical protein